MKQRPLRPRDLVTDNYGRDAILTERVPTPSKLWLDRQADTRLRSCGRSRWWSAIPLSGGAVITPERHAVLVREATSDDVRLAVACAMPAGVTGLVKLFPELASAPFILGRALIAKSPTHALRHRLPDGSPSPAEAALRRIEMTLVAFVERAVTTLGPDPTREALREAVGGLRAVLDASKAPEIALRPEERARLVAFLGEISEAGGLDARSAEEAMREVGPR